MLRFQTAIASCLGALLVLPAVFGQGEIAALEDALNGTLRALGVLEGIQKKLQDDPAGAVGLLLSATESAPSRAEGDERASEGHLESLRNEVNLLQMELDALESPLTDPSGVVTSALGAREPLPLATLNGTNGTPGITTGLDDSLRALLAPEVVLRGPVSSSMTDARRPREGTESAAPRAPEGPEGKGYSADPLRQGIACYRAGRFPEALELLAPLESDATALYWRARTLERLERLDEAISVLERAIARGGEGFELRRAQTDLEFLRWKHDFLETLPVRAQPAPEEKPR